MAFSAVIRGMVAGGSGFMDGECDTRISGVIFPTMMSVSKQSGI
jgi:hypothetical protein